MSHLLEAMVDCLLLIGLEGETTVVYMKVKDDTKLPEMLLTTDDLIKIKMSSQNKMG